MQIELHNGATGEDILINRKPHSVTVSWNFKVITTFDMRGRLLTHFDNGIFYQRGLDNRLLCIFDDGDDKRRCIIRKEKAVPVIESAYRKVADVVERLRAGEIGIVRAGEFVRQDVEGLLAPIRGVDYAMLEETGKAFRSLYAHIPVLPPDQYMALYIQFCTGCPYNRCSFCSLYRDSPFHVRTLTELSDHLDGISMLFEGVMGLRKSIFIGDANALAVPHDQLVGMIEMVHERFDMAKFSGIYSFIDAMTTGGKPASEFDDLRRRGLRRVYIGLETGNKELYRLINKGGTVNRAIATILTAKEAGLAVGVIVMAGIGGENYYDAHVNDTLSALERMNLGEGDIVYISPLIVEPDTDYVTIAADEGIRALGKDRMAGQTMLLKENARNLYYASAPVVTMYDISRFIY